MRNLCLKGIFAAIVLLAACTAAHADAYLGFPTIGVRGQAMGNSFVAVANDISAIGWNPAGLAFVEDQQGQIAHSDLYQLGIDYNYVAYAQNKFGVGWGHIDSGSFLMGGGDFTQDMFIFSGSQQVDPQTYLGASLKWHRQKYNPPSANTTRASEVSPSYWALSADGFSLDVGAMYLVDEVTTVGAAVYDLFGEIKTKNSDRADSSDNLKPNICIGISRRTQPDTLYSLQISRLGEESTVHFGFEKQIQQELVIRAGVDDEVFTAGLGFLHEDWEINYSYKNETSLGLEETQRFGAIVHF